MARSDSAAQKIHFGDDINLVKSTGYSATRKLSLSEKDDDLEADHRKFADADRNRKKKQIFTGWYLAWLAYQSTGVIYGDIGTSPLYVYSATFPNQPSYDDLVGALSIIIWTLTLMVTIKYMLIVLSADDDGEGGTFALYTLLARYANIVRNDPNIAGTVHMERHLTGELKPTAKNLRYFIEHNVIARNALKVTGVLGVTLVMADGVLTPAQSVLGAIQGLTVASSDITTPTIIGVSCAILVLLFVVQPFGTAKVASAWAPIVIVWLLFNLCSGIYNLAMFDHSVLKAFSPYFAGAFLVRNGQDGWRSLGGLLLAFTGVEALFADLGAFSKRAIQLSWLCFAYPCLLLAYIGQAAYIAWDGEVNANPVAFSNPFFYTVPPGTFYFSLVIAILAAIVASQAMITSSFQLLIQVMNVSYFPHIKAVHKSKIFHNQIYIPMANWLLMIGTVVVTAVYNNTTSLGNAYGVCVVMVTLITTSMVSLVALIVWRINAFLVLFFFLAFSCLDAAYLSSALTKVPNGAWFTLMLASILSTIFILWRYGKENQWNAEAADRIPVSQLLKTSADGETCLTQAFGGGKVGRVSGVGIFFDKSGDMIPIAFLQFIRKFAARPEIIIFLHLRALPVPSISESERYIMSRTAICSCYRLTIRHGYTDSIVTPDLGRMVMEQLILLITLGDNSATLSDNSSASSKPHSPEVQAELDTVERAFAAQTTYIMGKEQMKIRPGTNFVRKWALDVFLWIRENSRTKMASLDIPTENLVEVGFVKEI